MGSPYSFGASYATGGIYIDTSQVKAAAAEIANLSKSMTSSFLALDKSVANLDKRFNSSMTKMENSMESLNKQNKQFLAFTSILQAAAPAAAYKISTNFARLELLMKRLVGSEVLAQKEMDKLKDFARDTAQPYDQILHSATSILPLLKGTNVELTDAVSLITRLSTLDPLQGISGASTAVKEILSGEYLSLVRRFELDRNRLKDIRNQSGGDPNKILDLLNEYLTEIGYGPDMLQELEAAGVGSFDAMLSELRILIDDGFRPLRDEYILPLIRLVKDLAMAMQKIDPAILSALIGGGSILSAGMGLSRIPGMGGLAQAGVLGAAAYGGVEAGTGLVRLAANQDNQTGIRSEGLERFSGKSQAEAKEILKEDFKNVLKILGVGLVELAQQATIATFLIENAFKQFPEQMEDILSEGSDLLTNSLNLLASSVEYGAKYMLDNLLMVTQNLFSELEKIGFEEYGIEFKPFEGISDRLASGVQGIRDSLDLTDAKNSVDLYSEAVQNSASALDEVISREVSLTDTQQDTIESFTELQKTIAGLPTNAEIAADVIGKLNAAFEYMENFGDIGALAPDYSFRSTEEQFQAFVDYKDAIKEAEIESDEEILKINEEYQKDLVDMEQELTDKRNQLMDDFNLEQKRKQEDYLRKRNEILNAQNDDTVEKQYEYQKKITEINDDANQSQIDAANEYYQTLEELQRQYLFDLNEAASSLDVSKVISLQNKYGLDTQKATDDFTQEQAQIEENRKKRVEEERITLNEVLNENIKNRDERLRELDEENKIRQQREAEDFMIDLAKMQEEHNKELAERKLQHEETLAELAAELDSQKNEILQKFIELHDKLAEEAGQHQSMMLGVQRQGMKLLEAEFKAFWERQRTQATARPIAKKVADTIKSIGGILPTFATGGEVYKTGFAKVEKGEHVLRPDAANAMRSIMGSEITPNNMRSAFQTSSPNITITNQNNFGDVGRYTLDQIESLFNKVVKEKVQEVIIATTRKQ